MRIEEYMEKYGLTYKQVYGRIQNGDLPAVKSGKSWNITLDVEPVTMSRPRGSLSDAHTAMKIKKIQQQLREGEEKIQEEYRADVIEGVVNVMGILKTGLAKLKLSKSDTGKIKCLVEKCLTQLEKSLEE